MRTLLTGFTSFQGVDRNPTELVVEAIRAQNRSSVYAEVLPVAFQPAGERLVSLLKEIQPDVVLCTGVAQSRAEITPERFALNVEDAAIPDNEGILADGTPIIPGAPLAYLTTLPVLAIRAALRTAEIPCKISNHAGAYVCNHVFYRLMHALAGWEKPVMAGFVHVPGILSDERPTGLPIETIQRAVELILSVCEAQLKQVA
ncbi:MAG: pyroglutamyl-peptidase I [Anaerolineae bacterium]